jgi:hypothetical protein
MAFVKIEYVYKLMEEKNLPYFRVMDGKLLIGENDEESEVQKAVDMLQETIEMVEDSMISIVLSDKTRKERGKGGSNWDTYNFKIKLKGAETASGGINGTILSMMEKNSTLLRQIEIQQKEHEMEALKKQIAELKDAKEKPDMWERYLPLLATHFTGNKIAVAGHEDEPIQEVENTMQEDSINKIKRALKILSKVDNDLPNTLMMLATFAQKQPEKYKSFIPIIKTQI